MIKQLKFTNIEGKRVIFSNIDTIVVFKEVTGLYGIRAFGKREEYRDEYFSIWEGESLEKANCIVDRIFEESIENEKGVDLDNLLHVLGFSTR